MSAPFPHFIIIDDSQLDCFIGEKIIQNTGLYSSIKSFTAATDAYNYIKSPEGEKDILTIIVLDIQMPVMNGFEFVEAFEQLTDVVKNRYAIYMFSSSINENDKIRLENYPCVRKFYGKPISKDIVAVIVEAVSK